MGNIDFDPLALTEQELGEFFTDINRNNLDGLEEIIGMPWISRRVNFEFKPMSTQMTFPDHMAEYRKTSLVKHTDDDEWGLSEDRVDAQQECHFTKETRPALCVVFLQQGAIHTQRSCIQRHIQF